MIVLFQRSLGPYRVSLFNSLSAMLEDDFTLILTRRDRTPNRSWTIPWSDLRCRVVVLPGHRLNVGRGTLEVSRGVGATLDDLKPQAIVLAGWDVHACWSALRWARQRGVPLVGWVESSQRTGKHRGAISGALRRRSWWALGLAALATVLTASPTCVLALAASVPLYYVLTGTRRSRVVVVLALAVSLPAAVLFVYTAGPNPYLNSHNTAGKAVGRLLAGIEYAKTDGRAGHNTRLADTRVVISAAKANGWILAGAGPAADQTYFPARFPSGTLRPNALWVSVLFDFGLIGVLLLGTLMVIAVWRMRRRPQMCAILLPFFVASLINSAGGSFEYGFVALGIVLFAFGWAGTSQAGDPSPAVQPGRPAVLEAGRTQA